MKTPIHEWQRRRAEKLILQATSALEVLSEDRLNLDPTTRDAINDARGNLAEADRLLADQPAATYVST